MKKYLLVLFLIIFLAPSAALASWWNPFSWKVFKKREPAPQVQVINTEKTPEEKIAELQKQLDELKAKKTSDSVVQSIIGNNNIQKKTVKTVTTPDNSKTTIIIPPAVTIFDVCKNIEGIQNIAPEGMTADSGNCSKVDLCPYLAYDQFILPGGMVRDPNGMCYYPGDDFCPNISGFQNLLPDGYTQTGFRGDCIKNEDIGTIDSGNVTCYGSIAYVSDPNEHKVSFYCDSSYKETNLVLDYIKMNFQGISQIYFNGSTQDEGYLIGKEIPFNKALNAGSSNTFMFTVSSRFIINDINIYFKVNGLQKRINLTWNISQNQFTGVLY